MTRARLRLVCGVFLATALAFVSTFALSFADAFAHMGETRGQLGVKSRPEVPPAGPRGSARVVGDRGGASVHLSPVSDGVFGGAFEISNAGAGPLRIYKVAVLVDDAGQARAPAGIGIQTLPGSSPTVPPGGSRLYNVQWRREVGGPDQLSGYLSVETDAGPEGSQEFDPPKIVALEADARPRPLRAIITLILLWPLVIAASAIVMRGSGPRGRWLRAVAASLSALFAALSFVPLLTLTRALTRADGTDGLGHVERTRLGGLDYFVGVDGVSAVLLPVVGVAFASSIFAARADRPEFAGQVALASGLAAASVLVLVGQTILLFAVGFVGVALLIGVVTSRRASHADPARAARAGARTLTAGAVGSAALVLFVWLLSRVSGPSVLGDGSFSEATLALPELARAAAHGHLAVAETSPLFGLPFERGLVVLLFAAALALAPGLPLHSWLSDALADLEPSLGAMIASAATIASAAVVLRLALPLLPHATAWAAPGLAVLGIATLLVASLRAATVTDVREIVGHLAVGSGGLLLASPCSLTPQGIQGALAVAQSRSLALPLLLLVTGAVIARTGERRLSRIGGLGGSAPWLSILLGLAVIGSAGLPGGSGFWGAWLALLGSVGRNPHLSLGLGLALGAFVVAHVRLLRIVFSPEPQSFRVSRFLEPFGGKAPDLRRDERGWAVILAVVVLLVAFAPRLWLSRQSGTILDLHRPLDPPGPTQVS